MTTTQRQERSCDHAGARDRLNYCLEQFLQAERAMWEATLSGADQHRRAMCRADWSRTLTRLRQQIDALPPSSLD
jgi:hypothetical protein